MELNDINLEEAKEGKIIRLDDQVTERSCYIQIRSQNFEFVEYDRGTIFQKMKYQITPDLNRYFQKRKFLFSLFDQGIQLDRQSWFSAIPEPVSLYLRKRFQDDGFSKVFQPFSGVGGIAIHLCDAFQQYILNDICLQKIKMLKNNMKIYGKDQSSFQYYCLDFLLVPQFTTEMLIICPPWGGIDTKQYSYRDLDQIMEPTLTSILTHALKFSKNIMLQMPKNTNIMNLLKIVHKCNIYPIFTIEKIKTNGKTSQLFIYFGQERFTHIRSSSLYTQIYKDLKINEKKQKKDTKKHIKENADQIMAIIYKNRKKKKKFINFVE